jgi:diketogulonate reductase-like aldo/keto reductase
MQANLAELQLDYVDMTLMHFPVGTVGNKSVYDYVETWKEMEKHVGETGKPTRYIGISNFNETMLDELLKAATIKPKVRIQECR